MHRGVIKHHREEHVPFNLSVTSAAMIILFVTPQLPVL